MSFKSHAVCLCLIRYVTNFLHLEKGIFTHEKPSTHQCKWLLVYLIFYLFEFILYIINEFNNIVFNFFLDVRLIDELLFVTIMSTLGLFLLLMIFISS